MNSTAEKLVMNCQRVAEEIAYRFQGQNNYFRLSVEQGFQLMDGHTALKLEDVILHTKAYLDSAWTNVSVDRLVDSLLRTNDVVPWQTTREEFEQVVKTYISNARSGVGRVIMNEAKQGILEAASILELVQVRFLSRSADHNLHVRQGANSNEEEWLKLAKTVDKYTAHLTRDILSKLWEPYSEDPLWPSIRKYFA
jgi:hypothetical protein